MSKSNLKNLNTIGVTKRATIQYTNSTYSNLLLKLKKSIIFSHKYLFLLKYSYINEDQHSIIFFKKKKKRYLRLKRKRFYRVKKCKFVYSNINTIQNINIKNEIFFKKKISYY